MHLFMFMIVFWLLIQGMCSSSNNQCSSTVRVFPKAFFTCPKGSTLELGQKQQGGISLWVNWCEKVETEHIY